jgi:hypothetical protein
MSRYLKKAKDKGYQFTLPEVVFSLLPSIEQHFEFSGHAL